MFKIYHVIVDCYDLITSKATFWGFQLALWGNFNQFYVIFIRPKKRNSFESYTVQTTCRVDKGCWKEIIVCKCFLISKTDLVRPPTGVSLKWTRYELRNMLFVKPVSRYFATIPYEKLKHVCGCSSYCVV